MKTRVKNIVILILLWTMLFVTGAYAKWDRRGGAYVDQNINGVPDNKKLYLAVGIEFSYKISPPIMLRASYDNINSVIVGTSLNLDL